MTTPTLIGVAEPRGSYTARYLRYGDQPAALVPLLRRIWVTSFSRDTDAMSAGLLARDWASLTVDPEPSRVVRDAPVPGLGRPAPPRPRGPHLAAASSPKPSTGSSNGCTSCTPHCASSRCTRLPATPGGCGTACTTSTRRRSCSSSNLIHAAAPFPT